MPRITNLFRKAALLVTAAAVLLCLPLAAQAVSEKPAKKAPQVEVVFCLDTTGSMVELIEGAKQKIWAISNQIASGRPTPRLKVGLVAFRDRGDAYITKVFDLTDDLDAIYGHLKQFKAEGGGDFPESVNQALHESVTKIKWSKDKKTLRMIFLVGDAPPHMDYKDDVKYPVTCKLAKELDIRINTVQCGNHPQTRKFWEAICNLAGGSYVQIAQNGGVVAIATPYDKELAKINGEMARTTLVYGDREVRARGKDKKKEAAKLSAPAAAERAAFAAKSGRVATYDLLDSINAGKVRLEKIKKNHLPAEMQKMTLKEQQAFLKKLGTRRAELVKKAVDLDKKRAAYIKEKLSKDNKKAKDGFDQQVLKILQKQAKQYKINFKD
jgi:Mg-chelatase subunit ChlD